MKTRCVVFDLDGTLVPTMSIFADVAAELLDAYGLDRAFARDQYLVTSGLPFRQQLEIIAPRDERNQRTSEVFERRKLEATFDVVPSVDTIELLARLRGGGVKLVISSNNFQREVDRFVATCPVAFELGLGFAPAFEKGRPHFEHIMTVLSLAPGQLLFVGDSINDGRLARACSVPFVALVGTLTREQFAAALPSVVTIDHLEDLAAHVSAA